MCGSYTLAIPEGEYNTVVSFEFPYGKGSQLGSRSDIPRIQKTFWLKQGQIYRYRLKNDPINKKDRYKTIFKEMVTSKPINVKIDFTHTIIFKEKINE